MKEVIKDGRRELYEGNKMVGYLEDGALFMIGKDGWAIEVCQPDDHENLISIMKDLKREADS